MEILFLLYLTVIDDVLVFPRPTEGGWSLVDEKKRNFPVSSIHTTKSFLLILHR